MSADFVHDLAPDQWVHPETQVRINGEDMPSELTPRQRREGLERLQSVDRCPEWNCPDLSSEDRRDGKTCADHPCTCSTARDAQP